MRSFETGLRTRFDVAIEALVYAAFIAGATLLAERDLLREMVGYVRGQPKPSPAA